MLASCQGSEDAGQHHHDAPAVKITGTQPGRKHLAVPARKLALKQNIPILQRHPRPLLLRLEQTYRAAIENYVNRIARLGESMILFAGWYYSLKT